MLFVVNGQSMQDVAQQQEGQINGPGGVNQCHRKEGQAKPEGVVPLPLFSMAKEDQDSHDQTELAGHAWEAGIEGFSKQSEPQSHAQHGVSASAVSVHRSDDAQEQNEEGVMAELKHRLTRINSGKFHHPCGDGWVGRGVGPETLVGTRKAEVSFQDQLLGEHRKPNPIHAKWKALQQGGEQGCRGNEEAHGKQPRWSVSLKFKLNFCFLAER